MRPIEELTAGECSALRVIASDIDDTMTLGARLSGRTLHALERARDAGLSVVVVTGRPAGFVMALAAYLPGVDAVIGENGGVLAGPDSCQILPAGDQDIAHLRERLAACHADIAHEAPEAVTSGDTFARLTDHAYLVDGLSAATRSAIDRVAARHGFETSASSIHVHVKLPGHTKGRALARWLAARTPAVDHGQVLTVGDSETDATLFDTNVFPLSVGVANIERVLGRLATPPAFVTRGREGAGFVELLDWVLARRSSRA
ncbi:MAG: HAD hydrolase family protein [Candidatus Wallbacteria bacterium]|nr:HAD hydrolase family protein [Candidatus Wallbacteria bacterium]